MFELMEVGGFYPAIQGMRNPTKTRDRSDSSYSVAFNNFMLGKDDARLAKNLLKKGPVHGKFQRGIIAWFDIEMPRYIWSELDTYVVGATPISSESTMYTLTKECAEISPAMFSSSTPLGMVEYFEAEVDALTRKYGGRKNIPIEELKACLPDGWLQKRTKAFSYQTLASIYAYRKDHRLPEWQYICGEIEKLPFFKELLWVFDDQ